MTDDEIQKAFDRGMYEGVQRALAEHKRAGRSIVVERDGKIIEIPAEEITVDPEFADPPLRQAR
ncbi:MAG: hypothetical protein KF886_01945 [Candidatus Hydrogenedentes bacterium]|nr:hypothetical protein [Candidatus Hydrogenedentota bacterium]